MTEDSLIRVIIVDDHAMVRRGLSAFMLATPGIELVGEATNGFEALKLCEEIQPDVVLMDLIMPSMDGPTAIKNIREKFPNIQAIALTSFQEDDLIKKALGAGAISYLLKNVTAEDLADAIRAAYNGMSTLTPEAVKVLLQPKTENVEQTQLFDLTEREIEVLALMADGLNNPEIATKLYVSRSTVKAHVSHILAKLNVANRTEAITIALKNNII
jgi:DNA-binding NarL/FixJ family response regulator